MQTDRDLPTLGRSSPAGWSACPCSFLFAAKRRSRPNSAQVGSVDGREIRRLQRTAPPSISTEHACTRALGGCACQTRCRPVTGTWWQEPTREAAGPTPGAFGQLIVPGCGIKRRPLTHSLLASLPFRRRGTA